MIIAVVTCLLVHFTGTDFSQWCPRYSRCALLPDDPPLYRLAIITGCICLWLMWLIVYVAQVNPLLAPAVKPQPPNNSSATAAAARADL